MKRVIRLVALALSVLLTLAHGPAAEAANLIPIRRVPDLIGPLLPPIAIPVPERLCAPFSQGGSSTDLPLRLGNWTFTRPWWRDETQIGFTPSGLRWGGGPLRITLPVPAKSVELDITIETDDDIHPRIVVTNSEGTVSEDHGIQLKFNGRNFNADYPVSVTAGPGQDIQHLDVDGRDYANVGWHLNAICYKPLKAPDVSVAVNGPGTAKAGDAVSVQVELTNIGDRSAAIDLATDLRRQYLDLVLSGSPEPPVPPQPYSEKYANGVRLKTVGSRNDSIAAGYPVTERVTVLIPEDTPTGLYCLGAVFDPLKLVSEATRDNNAACSWLRIEGIEAPPAAPGPAPCTDAPFADVPATHGSCSAITLLVGAGIVNGISPTQYGPDRSVTRAEMAKLLVATLGLPQLPGASSPFSDVAGHWAFTGGWGQQAVAAGMIAGYPDGTFAPDAAVKRSEAVKMAASVVQSVAGGMGPAVAPDDRFTDVPGNAWYHDWVAAALQAGLLGDAAPYSLFTGATFAGERVMTRAEAAQLLANLLELQNP